MFKEKMLGNLVSHQGLIIDTHTHIGVSLNRYVKGCGQFCQSIEELEMKMKHFGVDYSIVFPFPELNGNKVRDIYTNARHNHFVAEEFPYQLANSYLLSEIKRKKFDRLIPFMLINPTIQLHEQMALFEKYQNFVFGFKIHTTSNEISPRNLPREFIHLCNKFQLPIIFHTRACEPQYNCWSVIDFAEKNPNINVCVAHCAGFDELFFSKINQVDNVFFDISPLLSLCYLALNGNEKIISSRKLALDYSNPKEVFERMYELAPNRILWATDEPCGLDSPDKYHKQVVHIQNSNKNIKSQIHCNVYNFLTHNHYESI